MAARCLCSSLLSFSPLSAHKFRSISSSRTPLAQLGKFRIIVTSPGVHEKLHICVAAVDEDDDNDGDAGLRKGRQLWRNELGSSEFESFDNDVRQSSTLERDIERLTKKEEVDKLLSQALGGSKEEVVDRRGVVVRDVTDKILVADFFFILFSLAWLVAGLVERAALKSSSLIDSWLPLWPSVFQPALGVFMAGAIASALTKKK